MTAHPAPASAAPRRPSREPFARAPQFHDAFDPFDAIDAIDEWTLDELDRSADLASLRSAWSASDDCDA